MHVFVKNKIYIFKKRSGGRGKRKERDTRCDECDELLDRWTNDAAVWVMSSKTSGDLGQHAGRIWICAGWIESGLIQTRRAQWRPIGGCRESHGHHSGIRPSQENLIWLLILVSQSSGRSLIWKDHVIVAANFQGNYLNILLDTQKVYDEQVVKKYSVLMSLM